MRRKETNPTVSEMRNAKDILNEARAEAERAGRAEAELKQRIAELETAVATLEDKCDEYAAALNDRAELCDRLRAYCRRDRRAVGVLGRELETRSGICACDVQDGWEQHRAGNTVGACWAAWARERRAVDKLAEHIEIACEGFAHGGMSAMEVAPGGYMDAAEIAAWARNRARGESGE